VGRAFSESEHPVLIRRRHVFYVEGYDPQGAAGYYNIFERSWQLFRRVWQVDGKLGKLELDSELIAHWDVEAAGPNWQVATRYEFLRLEDVIAAAMAEPMWRQVPRALAWAIDDLVSGTTARIFRAAWRFAVHLIYFQALLLLWLAASIACGWLAGLAVVRLAGAAPPVGIAVGMGAAIGCFLLLRPLADRWLVVQINNCWPYLRELARGKASFFDRPIDHYAARIVAGARAREADEIVVVGHSAGGLTASMVMARALELDPEVGRRGPQLLLLTLGSCLPAAALHPAACRTREMIARLAAEPSLVWVDCVSRKDAMNFWNFDPVAGVGIEAPARRCNPLVWRVVFKEALSPERYRQLHLNSFRLHFQFIMSGDRRGPFNYLMLIAGPVAIADWARQPDETAAAFGPDGALAPVGDLGATAAVG